MIVPAQRVGLEVPGDFDAEVAGVHSAALDLRIAERCARVRMVALQAAHLPMTPVGVSVPWAEICRATPPRRIAARGGVWDLGKFGVDTRASARYEGSPRCVAIGPGVRPELRRTLTRHARVRGSALDLHAVAAVAERLTVLSRACAAGEPDLASDAAKALIGLGPGLTPSGDDALCGFIAARHSFAEPSSSDAAVRQVASSAWLATSDVSAQHLSLAARGLFGEALLAVVHEMGVPGAGLERAAARCASVGASSGADALLGIIAALDTLPD